MVQRRGIDEGFETGAGLTARLGGMVILVGGEVEAPDQRLDRAVLRIQCHQRTLDLGQLSKRPAFTDVSNVYHVAGRDHLGHCHYRRSARVDVDELPGPDHVFDRYLDFFTGRAQRRERIRQRVQYQRRFNAAACRILREHLGHLRDHGLPGHWLGALIGCLFTVDRRAVDRRRCARDPQRAWEFDLRLLAAIAVAAVVAQQTLAERMGRGALHRCIDGGVRLVARAVHAASVARQQLPAYPFGRVGRGERQLTSMHPRCYRCIDACLIFLLGDRPLIQHATQHQVTAFQGAFGAVDGVAGAGRLGDAGQHCELLQPEFRQGHSVVGNSGRFGAVGAFAERNHVQVQLQDFVL